MAQISVTNLTFAYPNASDNVFENLTLHLDTRWRLGLIGRNGRGKTTLLRLLAGELSGTGSVNVPGKTTVYPPPTPPREASVHAVMCRLAPGLELWQAECELAQLDTHIPSVEVPFDSLSPGERTKVLLAAQFLADRGSLLIDEPTNHLDAPGRRALAAYLARKDGFLVTSHDREFLDGCTDHILALNRTSMELRKGSFSAWKADFENRLAAEDAQNARLKKEIRRLREAADRSAGWSARRENTKTQGRDSGFEGHRAAKMMKRAKTQEKRQRQALAEAQELLHDAETPAALKMFPLTFPRETLASFSDVAPSYPGAPFSPATFAVCRGDRIVLEGQNGTGKTSLLRLLEGEDLPHTGRLHIAGSLRVSWLPQDTSCCRGSLRDLASVRGLDWTQFLTMLRQLDFPRSHLDRDLQSLSEGQRKKALLGASLCEQAHLYVWDEPLNYVDLYTRMQIEELVLKARPTLLIVEHDLAFVEAVATKRIRLTRSAQPAAAFSTEPATNV